MRRRYSIFASWLFLVLVVTARGEEAQPPAPKKLVVDLWVVEVSTDKLQALGFNWEQLTTDGVKKSSADQLDAFVRQGAGSGDQFLGFLKALEQNSLARTLCKPTLATLDGRPASLAIGDLLELDLVPIVTHDSNVRLEYRLKISARELGGNRSKQQRETLGRPVAFRVDAAAELELGKTRLMSHTRIDRPAAEGKAQPTELLVLARVDLIKPDSLPVADGTTITADYREIPRSASRKSLP
jgi:hypothetical protein